MRETVHLGPSEAGPCMHLNHAQPCNTCVEAPSAEEQDACELCGDKGEIIISIRFVGTVDSTARRSRSWTLLDATHL